MNQSTKQKNTTEQNKTTIKLNHQNVITHLGEYWNERLLTPKQPLFAESLLGQSIFDFISGDQTQLWLDTVLQTARMFGTKEINYRCDSPDKIRACKMIIQPGPGKNIVMEHHILYQKPLSISPANSGYGYESTYKKYDPKDTLTCCSICCKIKSNHTFVEPSDFCIIARIDPYSLYDKPNHYVVCPECLELKI